MQTDSQSAPRRREGLTVTRAEGRAAWHYGTPARRASVAAATAARWRRVTLPAVASQMSCLLVVSSGHPSRTSLLSWSATAITVAGRAQLAAGRRPDTAARRLHNRPNGRWLRRSNRAGALAAGRCWCGDRAAAATRTASPRSITPSATGLARRVRLSAGLEPTTSPSRRVSVSLTNQNVRCIVPGLGPKESASS